MTRLGPYRLDHRIGGGGMGEVWSATHSPTRTRVAIKVLAPHLTNTAPLRAEVEAVAALHHPHIVQVLDFGTADRDAGASFRERPFLVMELVDGGTLADRAGQMPWNTLRRAIDQLLDALAFSHARGIIHRDVKPPNVLMTREGQPRLADFGLAFALEAGGARSTGGTPRYMAPEQIESTWRDHGPWTDLHAVGWTALALVRGDASWDVPPRVRVPAGFDDWVRRMTDPDPGLRYRRAADARFALARLELTTPEQVEEAPAPPVRAAPGTAVGPDLWGVTLAPLLDGDDDTSSVTAVTGVGVEWPTLVVPPGESVPSLEGTPTPGAAAPGVLSPPARPPTPDSWRQGEQAPFPSPMLGAGLGLVGLRVLPMVDRDEERDRLWSALLLAERESRLVVRILQGSSGAGKTRLAGWIAEKAHECGSANVLKAEHGPDAGPGQGIPGMLARHFRIDNLKPHPRLRRLSQTLAQYGERSPTVAAAFDAWVSFGRSGEGDPEHQFASDEERFELLHRHLARLAERRPVVLLLDDVQWGPLCLTFILHILKTRALQAPILALLTVREEALPERPDSNRLLREIRLAAQDPEIDIRVGPLPANDHRALLRGLLGLDDALFAEVEERTGGNPLFAVELVSDWAQRGALIPASSGGFRLDRTRAGALPEDLRSVWSDRVDRALHGVQVDPAAIEAAAVLGPLVEPPIWERTCLAAGVVADRAAIEALRRERLLLVDRDGWRFVHGMLRETLEARAEASGRAKALHLAAAQALTAESAPGRRGLHLLRGGLPIQASVALLDGARAEVDRGDSANAFRLLDAASTALQAGVPEDLPEAAAVHQLLLARAHLRKGAHAEVLATAPRGADEARRVGRPIVEAGCATLAARALRGLGKPAEADRWLDRAVALRRSIEDPWTRIVIDLASAVHDIRTGQIDAAEETLRAAQQEAERADSWPRPRWFWQPASAIDENLAAIYRLRGDPHRMILHLERARAGHRASRYHLGELSTLVLHGEALRMMGDNRGAEALFEEARARMEAVGSALVVYPWCNLLLIATIEADDTKTAHHLAQLLPRLDRGGPRSLAGMARLAQLSLLVAARDLATFDATWARAHADLAETRYVDIDVAQLADVVAARAIASPDPWPERAVALRELAAQQRLALQGRTG